MKILGVLFELMTTDIRQKTPETIQHLIDKNFTILCMYQQEKEVIQEMIGAPKK